MIKAVIRYAVCSIYSKKNMKITMHHYDSDNPFSFTFGALSTILTYVTIPLLAVNIPAWVPPLIGVFGAFAGGFVGMWGKDVYKDWKGWRERKRK
jgi:hypothetical protein